jgi:DNA-directed RNA polymerase subunit beta'
MVLGLYYMSKERLSTETNKILGQDLVFYSAEEVNIALNEGRLELNARVKIRAKDFNESGELVYKIIQTTAGRVLFNEVVPEAAGYINEVLTKKSLRDIIGKILSVTNVPTTAAFLDNMKDMGYKFAFKGGKKGDDLKISWLDNKGATDTTTAKIQ